VAEEGGKPEFVRFLVLLFIVAAGSVGGYKFLDVSNPILGSDTTASKGPERLALAVPAPD
jgi:hypothetical protein